MISTQIRAGFHFAGSEISGIKVLKPSKAFGGGKIGTVCPVFSGIRFLGGVSYPVL